MGTQFSNVTSQYGAPMGRKEKHAKPAGRTVRLYRVRLNSGGYDDGGAYWGTGAPLYCAEDTDGDYREFVRARTREEAAGKLEITDKLIRRVPHGTQ